jgi:hypothetical protein
MIGYFNDEEDAARAYDKKAIELFGYEIVKRKLNFPADKEKTMSTSFETKKREYTSEYYGVYLDKNRNKWVSDITVDKIKWRLGRFESEEEAARSYDKKAIELLGYEKAKKRLNFP